MNSGGYNDQIIVAMKVQPDYNAAGQLADYWRPAPKSDWPLPPIFPTFPATFLQHHAFREVQLVSLKFVYKQEIQVG